MVRFVSQEKLQAHQQINSSTLSTDDVEGACPGYSSDIPTSGTTPAKTPKLADSSFREFGGQKTEGLARIYLAPYRVIPAAFSKAFYAMVKRRGLCGIATAGA
jgi:hypothetical protein